MIPFTDAYISALSGAHPTRDGQFLNSTNAHGDSIKIDLSVEPPRRSQRILLVRVLVFLDQSPDTGPFRRQ